MFFIPISYALCIFNPYQLPSALILPCLQIHLSKKKSLCDRGMDFANNSDWYQLSRVALPEMTRIFPPLRVAIQFPEMGYQDKIRFQYLNQGFLILSVLRGKKVTDLTNCLKFFRLLQHLRNLTFQLFIFKGHYKI